MDYQRWRQALETLAQDADETARQDVLREAPQKFRGA